jgi:hypothetical protein
MKCGGKWLRRAKPRDEVSVFVGYDASSHDQFPTLRDHVVVSATRVKLFKKIDTWILPP